MDFATLIGLILALALLGLELFIYAAELYELGRRRGWWRGLAPGRQTAIDDSDRRARDRSAGGSGLPGF